MASEYFSDGYMGELFNPAPTIFPGWESRSKEVSEDKLQTVEGFAICQACLSSDAELAVHLARAQYQKRLQRLKDELGA